MVNLGDILVWGLRLSMLGLCLYGYLSRKKHFIRFGLSGLAGSILGWGMTHMILGIFLATADPITGFFAVLFGLALIWLINPGILKLLRRRRGAWIQVNDKRVWVPRGKGVNISLEFTMNPASPPTTKIEKSILPKKGEEEEEYKDRMR